MLSNSRESRITKLHVLPTKNSYRVNKVQQLLNTEVPSEILCTFPKLCIISRVAVVNNNEDFVTTIDNAKRETCIINKMEKVLRYI